MSIKDIKIGKKGLDLVAEGVKTMLSTVGATMGYAGKTVYIDRGIMGGSITKDGVSVAKEISLKDPYHDIGASMIREAAQQTALVAGDGTTTATVLASNMFLKGLALYGKGYNTSEMARGMKLAGKDITDKVSESSFDIKEDAVKLKQIAYVSSNGDEELAQVITDSIMEVGEAGDIHIKNSPGKSTSYKKSDGYNYNYGLYNQYFATKKGGVKAEYERPKVLIVDDNITKIDDLTHLLMASNEQKQPLIIIAKDVNQECLTTLAMTNQNDKCKVAVVSLPDYGELRTQSTRDLARCMGTTVVTREIKTTPKDMKWKDLGEIEYFKSDPNSTTIKFLESNGGLVDEVVAELKEAIESVDTDSHDIISLERRYKRLSEGIVTIEIQADSDVEFSERYDRADDAINAVKSAMADGAIDGGGLGLFTVIRKLEKQERRVSFFTPTKYDSIKDKSKSFNAGYDIVVQSCKEPIKQILKNAGVNVKSVLKQIESSGFGLGYNVESMELCNMADSGIIDPAKVTKTAIDNAISVTSTLLTTEAFITQASYLD